MKKLVQGVGINDADYVVQVWEEVGYLNGRRKRRLVWFCPFYRTWVDMLTRGYSKKFKVLRPTYKDCSVCEDWLTFSNFKSWMEKQDWQGKELDKDILVKGNKLYSPETCAFVSSTVNTFLTDNSSTRGTYLIGVSWNKPINKFTANCSNPFTKKKDYMGLFDSEIAAHHAWLKRKLEHAYALAALQTDERVARALIHKYENYRET